MGVVMSISKVKREKSKVMRRIYESCKGEYAKVFEYQDEVLRSNPDNTLAMCFDPNFTESIFSEFMRVLILTKRDIKHATEEYLLVIGIDWCFFNVLAMGS
jgi:hypothetical protein